jgi:hypothetical protein
MNLPRILVYVAAGIVGGLFGGSALAQVPPRDRSEAPPAGAGTPAELAAPGVRRALIVCGLAGDVDHRKLFAETVEKLCTGLTTHHNFARENVAILWGDQPTEKDGPALAAARGLATRDALTEAAKALKQTLQQDDTLWVFVLGHAHYDGRYSWLNLPGPDLHQIEFGGLFADVRCREQVFFMTTAASGFFIKPLAQPGRIVISATEPDREVNETMFPHKLALALAEPPPFLEFDMDLDGRLTLLDAYLWSARETAAAYLSDMLLATEHAQLDDNGDGRGTELQAQFLTEELGGKRKSGRDAPLIQTGDGAATRRVPLAYPPAPPAPEPESSRAAGD